MTRPRCGKVSFLGAPMPDGRRNITIDGTNYYTVFDPLYFPVTVGALVEFKAEKKQATITGLQVPLLDEPQAQSLFNSQAKMWKLTPADSQRILCDCGQPAEYGRTVNGGAPFFYECKTCAPKVAA